MELLRETDWVESYGLPLLGKDPVCHWSYRQLLYPCLTSSSWLLSSIYHQPRDSPELLITQFLSYDRINNLSNKRIMDNPSSYFSILDYFKLQWCHWRSQDHSLLIITNTVLEQRRQYQQFDFFIRSSSISGIYSPYYRGNLLDLHQFLNGFQ